MTYRFQLTLRTQLHPPALPARAPAAGTQSHPATDSEPHRGLSHDARGAAAPAGCRRGKRVHRTPGRRGALAHGGQLQQGVGGARGGTCGRVPILRGQPDGNNQVRISPLKPFFGERTVADLWC